MPETHRAEIHIPDHDVLRKIGGGSYGEVWMARGVTGALRAVKVVWREDFEDERGFEREFEGILKFEPISRDNPGMVDVLHVGRSDDEHFPFYYYVMELGDDIEKGRDIHPVEYEARTLRSDLLAAGGKPLDISFCLDVGLRLSAALVHLHEKDLAHRDIKPANVIFVDGKAKLADVGLVADRGQQTFVGTEGFVPPEGPGSSQADVYSLGKVLYEMSTGKDRLQFPELPDELPAGSDRKQWLALNQVICNVCEPKLSKRTIHTAAELHNALSKIQQGKKVRQQRTLGFKRGLLLLMLLGILGGLYYYKPWQELAPVSVRNGGVADTGGVVSKYKHKECQVQFISNPSGAKVFINGKAVYLDGEDSQEETPTRLRAYKPGEKVVYRFEKPGYRPFEKEYVIPDQEVAWFYPELATFLPPKKYKVWVDPIGVEYQPRDGFHESSYIQLSNYKKFLKSKPKVGAYEVEDYSERGKKVKIVFIGRNAAQQYAQWIERKAKESGLLEENYYVTYVQNKSLLLGAADKLDARKAKKLFATHCVVKKIPYASLRITSMPAGAKVYVGGVWKGVTPMELEKLRPGEIDVEVRLDGYKLHRESLSLSDNEDRSLQVQLKKNNGVIMGRKWVNGMKVPMVPLKEGVMAAVWEVRVKDYAEFTRATGHRQPKDPQFPQTPDEPVVGVSKSDAQAFCKWLTERERAQDRIGPDHQYRLPTDLEWSLFCGVQEDESKSPVARYGAAQHDPRRRDDYPWGNDFPPRRKVANLADITAAKAVDMGLEDIIRGYNDGYENTSKVGSFPANALGMYDISGNVFEWIEEDYNAKLDFARGGSWATHHKKFLKTWCRYPTTKGFRDNYLGFRYVLVETSEN